MGSRKLSGHPDGSRLKSWKAKGPNVDALHQKFEAIRKRAETEALAEVISDHKSEINDLKENVMPYKLSLMK